MRLTRNVVNVMRADSVEDPQTLRKLKLVSEVVAGLKQRNERLEKRVDKLRQTTVGLWGLADGYMAQLRYALAEKDVVIDDLRMAEERAEQGEAATAAWQGERAKLLEGLRMAEERVGEIGATDLQAEQVGEWNTERVQLQEELRVAEQRIVELELESTDMTEKLQEAKEQTLEEHRRRMRCWLSLCQERRETQILREALETGEFPVGIAQGTELVGEPV
ncbi:hypothetical protein EST38_g13850 [Candolleomyces aberdarensis]|uniref:Uncharacterized protein n=1 Tax=Candolleomyces aberdarensis TaxID=2316362 RepID=A0A4Q2D1K5_9AGAR|nr:hypothetical protein EST38_g13850 [Candolleomyces aberdarensis]